MLKEPTLYILIMVSLYNSEVQLTMDKKLREELDKIQPAWKNAGEYSDDNTIDSGDKVPSNYENSLPANPKSNVNFEVRKAPGRLG